MNPFDVKEKRLPRYPRLILGGLCLVPAVDDRWRTLKDQWMLPGYAQPMSTKEVRALAAANNMLVHILHRS